MYNYIFAKFIEYFAKREIIIRSFRWNYIYVIVIKKYKDFTRKSFL